MTRSRNDREGQGDGHDVAPILVRFQLSATLVTSPVAPAACSSAAAVVVGSTGDGTYYALTQSILVWDASRRHFGLSGEGGWALFSPENQRFEIIEMNGDLFRHGKVYGSPISAGGTGIVELWYFDGASETNLAIQVSVRDWTQQAYAVGDQVEIIMEPKSARWYLIASAGGTDTTQWVVVDDSVTVADGTAVSPFSRCLWAGKKLTIESTAATFCSGEDRYTLSTNVWLLSVDALNGSGSAAPRLYKGDRYLGKLVGTYEISGDSRPLYAIRKGTQHDVVRVVGESAEAVTGGNVTPHVGGVWNGEVLYVTVGATNFVGGATPYTSGGECWILAPDLPGGSVDVTARLKHNDRHPAIYLGEFDNGEGARPLYAIRMTTHFGWIKFKLSYAIGNTSSSQAATVLEYWGTKTPADGPVTVWNLEKNTAGTYVFQGVANAVGYAVWDEKTAKYKIVVMESDGKEPAYGGLQATGANIAGTAGASLENMTFDAEMEIVGMTRKTTTPHGLIADKAGDYLFAFTAEIVETSPVGGTAVGGAANAYLYKNGVAMNGAPSCGTTMFSVSGTGIHQVVSITHINSMAAGDYAHVKMGCYNDCSLTGRFTAVYLGPTDGSVAAPSPSLPPSPSARVQSGNDGGGEIPQQTLNHYYGG